MAPRKRDGLTIEQALAALDPDDFYRRLSKGTARLTHIGDNFETVEAAASTWDRHRVMVPGDEELNARWLSRGFVGVCLRGVRVDGIGAAALKVSALRAAERALDARIEQAKLSDTRMTRDDVLALAREHGAPQRPLLDRWRKRKPKDWANPGALPKRA